MASSMPSRARVNFHELVDGVADDFEARYGIPVSPEARRALIDPAEQHIEHVELELTEGNITSEFLENSLTKVLENAQEIASNHDRDEIDEEIIKESMNRYCPYLFWC